MNQTLFFLFGLNLKIENQTYNLLEMEYVTFLFGLNLKIENQTYNSQKMEYKNNFKMMVIINKNN